MNRLSILILLAPFTLVLPACSGNDQPQVEQLSKTQAAQKQITDEQLRIRQRTTQRDR